MVAVTCNKLDTQCVMCIRVDEDGGHLFCKCKFVKHIWRELNLEDVRCRLADQETVQSFMYMI